MFGIGLADDSNPGDGMARFEAVVTHEESGSHGEYPFDGPDDLLEQEPEEAVRHFMEHVDHDILTSEHIDYKLSAAMRNDHRHVVTAMGLLMREHGPALPFLLMISKLPA